MTLNHSIKILTKRLDYLKEKIKSRESSDGARRYLIEEVGAMKIAIRCVELCSSYGYACVFDSGPVMEDQIMGEIGQYEMVCDAIKRMPKSKKV